MLVQIGFYKDDDIDERNVVIYFKNNLVSMRTYEKGDPVFRLDTNGQSKEEKEAITSMIALLMISYYQIALVTSKPTAMIRKREPNVKEKKILIKLYKQILNANNEWAIELVEILKEFDFIKKLEV